ncbi:DUF3784 domain-containing protein [Telluribacter humicola]|uniref:DUF3784 domain-containing protein n=1 Tax=Telluribacter humicola TaxID=1720261 RepID=UPI001A973CBA|nr:DUF3784 domain-containing protein [Telluribacter humicola]
MIYVALFLSVIFTSIGFIVTRKNAKYILSGYNTMSDAERANVDINGYLNYFKLFHIILGVSLFVETWVISLINTNWASLFMITYPLVAYSWMVIQSTSYTKAFGGKRLISYITGGILLLIAVFIGLETLNDFQSNELILNEDSIEIKGSYGMTIQKQDVVALRLVKSLPPTSYKLNGFAAGDYAKGTFKLKNGQVVRMFVNKRGHQFLLINTTDGDVYYNSDQIYIPELERKLLRWKGIN